MKFLIPDSLRKSAGIYVIRAQDTAQVYIGATKNLGNRYITHVSMLTAKSHHATRLQEFVNRRGIACLRFELLESIPFGTDLAAAEQRWMDELKPYEKERGFNSASKVGQENIAQAIDPVISVRAQKSLIERGKQVAAKRGFSLSDLVRMLLIDEIERLEALERKATSK